MKMHRIAVALIVIIAVSSLTIAAQEQDEKPALSEKVFRIQYADLKGEIHPNVRRLLTQFGQVVVNESDSSILVRDTAEALSRIEDLIKTMDVPPDRLRMTFYAFKAARGQEQQDIGPLSPLVIEAIEEVNRLMTFDSFQLIDSGMLTLLSSGDAAQLTLSDSFSIEFRYSYNKQSKFMRLNNMEVYYTAEERRNLFRTDIGIGSGEVVVAGVSKLNGGDEAVLIILTMEALPIQNQR
jgi:hypothetical protein